MIHTTQTHQIGDCVELMQEMPAESIDTIITSPPYWSLRDYGVDGQIGLEGTLEEYHARLLEVTAECMRVLKPTGVMFWNHGDSYYAGGGKAVEQSFKRQTAIDTGAYPDHAPAAKLRGEMGKCITMQNERLIIRMIDDQGWILRNRIIWNKPNGMPSSVSDRFSNKYEPVYMLVKNNKPLYYCNNKTGIMQRDKPPGTKGDEGVDWDWKDVTTESGLKRKKVANWKGVSYWFDLDAVRKPYTETLNRWGGQQLKANGKSDWDKGTGQESYRDRDMRPNALGKNPGDVWTIPTQPYPESHFATFPTALIEPMIKAACPAEICPVCGMARERVTEPSEEYAKHLGKAVHDHIADDVRGMRYDKQVNREDHTTGWTSCNCDAGWIAGTVLDPFCGSGTVLEVCRLLNRNAIGLELNPEYEPLIRERSMTHTPPLTSYFPETP